jgi:hypothetical protein
MLPFRSLLGATVALLLPGLALAQQPQQQPPVVTRSAETTAIVESVNQQERSAVLQREDGSFVTVRVGPAVRNFAQVRPGDRVQLTYVEAIAASLAKADGRPPVAADAAAARAPVGARPAGAVVDGVRVRVRIEGIDLGRNSVTFTGPAGNRREVAVRDANMRRFIRTLRPGDEVDIVYAEVMTIAVLPPG